jgi:hypothetical protein
VADVRSNVEDVNTPNPKPLLLIVTTDAFVQLSLAGCDNKDKEITGINARPAKYFSHFCREAGFRWQYSLITPVAKQLLCK